MSMPVTSQLPIQTTKIFDSFFDVHLFPSTLKKVPPPMPIDNVSIFTQVLLFPEMKSS